MRDLIRRDQIEADQLQAIVSALIAGEQSGISARRIPEILAALSQELTRSGE